MNWDHLKVFLEVARQGNALRAAHTLGVNHSTIIRRIDQLEADVGARLFHRLPSGYQLTGEGRNVLAAAEQMEEGALRLERQLKGTAAIPAGVLHVSLPEVALLDLSEALAAFIAAYPQIELHIHNTTDASNLGRLEADAAVRLTDHPPEMLIGRRIGRVEFAAYAHHRYLSTLPPSPGPQDCTWLVWRGSRASQIPTVHNPDKILLSALPGVRVALSSNSMEDILAGIKTGIGVGLISRRHGEGRPDLVELPFSELVSTVGFAEVGLWVLLHRDMQKSAKALAFSRFMAQFFATADAAPPRPSHDDILQLD